MQDAGVLRFRRGDAVAIVAVLCAAIALLVFFSLRVGGRGRTSAQVYLNNALMYEMPLDADDQCTAEGSYRNVITVRDGRVAITESSCPGGDCMHSGWQSAPGRSIVCLPNRVEVRIVGDTAADDVPDAIVG